MQGQGRYGEQGVAGGVALSKVVRESLEVARQRVFGAGRQKTIGPHRLLLGELILLYKGCKRLHNK